MHADTAFTVFTLHALRFQHIIFSDHVYIKGPKQRPLFERQYIPDSATSEIGTFCSKDMNPRIEKIANPATKLVPLFRKHKAMQSLWVKKKTSKLTRYE